jgi:hypothetical protein
VGELGQGRVKRETCGTSETCHTRVELNSLPALAFSEAAGVVSTARDFLTRPPTGTPRRAISPGEGLLRPRVARAQKIISLHPLPSLPLILL